jgi:TatD DNase family protein
MLTDSHAHLYSKGLIEDLEAVLDRARAAGVDRMVCVGTDVDTSEQCFALARAHPELFPTAGIHPHDASDASAAARARVRELALSPECVAVGETGLDFFKGFSPREAQLESFHWHLDLARELDKPIVIHCRDAHAETLAALRCHPGVRGVMHCYTMGPGELPGYLELGLHISFSGVVTYPKNEANRSAAELVPEDRLLVETDCPYLAPQGHRGKRNEPAFVRVVLERVAEVRGVDPTWLAERTGHNAAELFGLPA